MTLSNEIKGLVKTIQLVAVLLVPLQVSAIDVDLGIDIKLGNAGATTEPTGNASTAKHNGPPDHAPAHGYRAKHKYDYYPDSQVYLDSNRGVYFYLSGKNWQMSANLPLDLKVKLGDHVIIEMENDKPYIKHAEHKASYPPGHMKKAPNKNKVAKQNGNKHKKNN